MSKRRKQPSARPQGGDPRPPRWQPMERATPVPMPTDRRERLLAMPDGAAVLAEVQAAEMWKNDRYTVTVTRWPEAEGNVDIAGQISELSIRRNDRRAVHDWRDFQRIKNEIAGPEIEAVELYPAESRLMDTANQYYLFCLPAGARMPFGLPLRNVTTPETAATIGAVQRELPEDWVPNELPEEVRHG
jgi:hypothetical protein